MPANLESDLRQALIKDEFVLYFQPKFALKANAIVGMEALIRWRHPIEGLTSPDEFVHVIEKSGLIVEIGHWALHQACIECKKLQANGLPELYVSVNVSPRQFQDATLVASVAEALKSSGLEGKYLDIELTESIIMRDDNETLNELRALRNLGVRISVDDFGVGYSSLRYLTLYPINTVKIDQYFINDLETNINNAIITKAIINLAHNLNLSVVAEGVESQFQMDYLKTHECDEVQGFFIGEATLPNRFLELYLK
jgi:EAL domain-containing protein (putative c-di-GMP-specific phosphodiesterase class I)